MGSGTTTKSSTSSDQTTTPQTPSWLSQPWQNLTGSTGALGSQDINNFITPASGLQNQAWNSAGQGYSGLNTINQGNTATAGLLGYSPSQVNASQVNASQVSPSQVSASQITPQQLAGVDWSKYLNPLQAQSDNVFQSQIPLALQQLGGANNSANSNATLQGGFGAMLGSRNGVTQGVNQSLTGMGLANLAAQLQQQNMQTAIGEGTTDIGNNLTSQQYNQNADLTAQQANQSAGLNAQLANQNAGLTAQQANQNAGLTAQQANQSAGLTANNQNLGAANQMITGGQAATDAQIAANQQQSTLGADQRAVAQSQNPAVAQLNLNQMIASILGQTPNQDFVGSNTTGTTTGKTTQNPSPLDVAGGALGGLGSLFAPTGAYKGYSFLGM